jgi:DNA mismatch repair ATPase MutS
MSEVFLQTQRGGQGAVAKWLIVVLLAVIAACLLIEVGASATSAQVQVNGAKSQSLFAVAGQVDKDTFGLYLVDLENGTICVYQYLPNVRKLRLMAARSTLYDRKLEEYNTELPPREIKKLVEQARSLDSATTRP